MRKMLSQWRSLWHYLRSKPVLLQTSEMDTVKLLREGWDSYASQWRKMLEDETIPALNKNRYDSVQYLGDEWTVMKTEAGYYGIDFASSQDLLNHMDACVLCHYLPSKELVTLEVGSGGGRFTQLLLRYSRQVVCADVSERMLESLKRRFADDQRVKYLPIDGVNLTGVDGESMDCVASFDTFVHIEPRQIFNYLLQFHRVMKPGAIGIIHHSNVDSEIGWQVFLSFMGTDLHSRRSFAAFSIMNPQLMKTFVERAGFKILALDCETLPRDCIAVFLKE